MPKGFVRKTVNARQVTSGHYMMDGQNLVSVANSGEQNGNTVIYLSNGTTFTYGPTRKVLVYIRS